MSEVAVGDMISHPYVLPGVLSVEVLEIKPCSGATARHHPMYQQIVVDHPMYQYQYPGAIPGTGWVCGHDVVSVTK